MKLEFTNWLNDVLVNQLGFDTTSAVYLKAGILFSGLVTICLVLWVLSKWFLNYIVPKTTAKTKTLWDDIVLNKKLIKSVTRLLPAIIFSYYLPFVFADFLFLVPLVAGATNIFIVIVVAQIFTLFFSSVKEILSKSETYKGKPIGSFTQLANLLVYAIAAILVISIVINKNPLYLLSGLGAMAAILLLVFKDSILGFVASIQLSAYNMVQIGDWVTVPDYSADGDVIEINLSTIKVQNWDKTITTIPTYAFISESFTNWKGMEKSGGRRIKRALNIKIDSIKFCSREMLEQFSKYQLIKGFILEKEKEITDYNKEHNVDKSELINGRQLTNIGVFRVYIEEYLKQSPNINQNMTLMVRQLKPNEYGLPIEIYAFSKDKRWEYYESIMADIFDHLFAAAPGFYLEIFERPSGKDFKGLGSGE